jgi:acetylornithine deacetylase/succinyl-diaminopimelate desuccinylase-like protein
MGLLNENHITDAANYATELWGLNYYGEQLDLAFAHEFMGPMTASQTFIGVTETELKTAVNLRVPVGRSVPELKAEIEQKIAAWVAPREMLVDIDVSIAEPMYRNPEGKWVNALLDVATEILDLPREFQSSAGATSVHYLPNGVQFGLSMPGVKYTGHNANEFKTVDQFMLDLQVVTEMMITVGQLPEL